MHPGMYAWWKGQRHRHRSCHAEGGFADDGAEAAPGGGGFFDGDFGAFGVRRPLRFLAYKLGLSEAQVGELARILSELKTERAQAAVDHRRTLAGFADSLEGDSFDAQKARDAAGDRVKSAERLRDALVTALGKLHAVLAPEQRKHLAYLIRTGALLI
jgi:Spy/CpxP family protein refolding chaperone